MFSAADARHMAETSTFDPMSEWTFWDTLEYKRIQKKIIKAATRHQKELELRRISELVKLRLESEHYKVTQFLGVSGAIKPWVGIYWDKEY